LVTSYVQRIADAFPLQRLFARYNHLIINNLQTSLPLAPKLHSLGQPAVRALARAHLTTLFGGPETQSKPKLSLLPLLTILFLVSYGLMTLLIVEQGSTIASQRTMIRQLLGDSTELSALKGKIVRDQAAAKTQTPSTQEPPSDPVHDKTRKETPAHKAHRPAPERPTKPAVDLVDVRRNLHSI
jgi:hypothetical protein